MTLAVVGGDLLDQRTEVILNARGKMMVSLRRPSTETIREFLASQSKLGFTNTALGAMASLPPSGYVADHTRIKLEQNEEVFTKAKNALGR